MCTFLNKLLGVKPKEQDIADIAKAVTREQIVNDLIKVARSKVGVREKGTNSGPDVEEFQRVIGKAEKEAWCLSFMQWVTKKVCDKYGIKNVLYPSEHCQTVYNNTPAKYKKTSPLGGYLFIQKNYANEKGHIGLVLGASKNTIFPTIEGNTDSGGSREGDGVYERTRSTVPSATRFVRGYIDLAGMILDAVLAANATPEAPKPTLPTNHVPNVKGDWNANLDSVIMGMVVPELVNLPYARMKKFMPEWDTMTTVQRTRFFADLMFAMCKYESNYNAKSMYWEDTMGLDAATGLPVVSEGMMQMSYQDAKWYNLPFFKYVEDAEKFKKDWENRGGRKSWLSMFPERSTLDPENGVRAAMVVFIKLLTNPKLKDIEFADTIGRYWAVMKRLDKNGKFREPFLGICNILKGKGYKT